MSTIRPPLPTIATPRGMGAYVRGDVAGWSSADASRRAALARSARLRWVVLMVEAVDGRRPDLTDLQRAATAYHEQGLSVGLWAFPHPTRRDPEYAVEALERALVGLESVGVPCAGAILDVEATDGGRMRPSAAWARELVQRADALCGPARWLGVTSYPVQAWHRLPWSDIEHPRAWGSPQLYRSALEPDVVRRSLREWGDRYGALVPSLPVYDVSGGTMAPAAQLERALDAVLLDARTGRPRVPGAALWSEPQIDRAEAAVLRAWAERHGW